MRNRAVNIVIVIVLVAVTFGVIFSSVSFDDFTYVMQNTKKIYIVYGILSLVVFWLLDAYVFFELTKMTGVEVTGRTAFGITMIGQYYSLITPSSAGGQPAQLYFMGKRKIPYGKGTAILVDKFIIFQVMVTLYSLVLFVLNLNLFLKVVKPAITFIAVGMIINTTALTGIIMLVFNAHLVEKVIISIMKLGYKVRIVKDYDGMVSKVHGHLEDYKHNIQLMLSDVKFVVRICLITLLQLTAFFGVTYFVYRALNLTGSSFMQVVALQSLLFVAVSFMPIPGTIGASEAGFYALLGAVFTPKLAAYGMLLWRGITFYLNLAASGISSLVLHFKYKGIEEKG